MLSEILKIEREKYHLYVESKKEKYKKENSEK